ncbi:hypothetical protein BR1R5_44730 [Pseudomonas sp. BR1R-5]|nr:hypothetical protein BR1R5_44730 [Pseudomonas sp. BR1R-5]
MDPGYEALCEGLAAFYIPVDQHVPLNSLKVGRALPWARLPPLRLKVIEEMVEFSELLGLYLFMDLLAGPSERLHGQYLKSIWRRRIAIPWQGSNG